MQKLYISQFILLWFYQVLENFVVDFKTKKKNILMKATVSQTVMFYFSFGFCGLGKSIQIS